MKIVDDLLSLKRIASFFAVAIGFAVPVLIYARTNIYPHDIITYTYALLLSISNLIASAICMGIFYYTLSKVKKFRKSLRINKI